MRKLLPSLLFIFTVYTSAYSQTFKLFLTADGSKTDSINAESYLICNRINDTTWVTKLFGLDDEINIEGTYKDKDLRIPHGRFSYYNKELQTEKNPNPTNYKELTGAFSNGKRTGVWINYWPNEQIRLLATYNDDKMHGLYESYEGIGGTQMFRGFYKNDLKEGEWQTLTQSGKVLVTEVFKDGVLINKIYAPLTFKAPVPPPNFESYTSNNIEKIIDNNVNGRLYVTCKINADGRITDVKFSGFEFLPNVEPRIKEIILKSGPWKSIYDVNKKQFINGDFTFLINLNNGDANVQYNPMAIEKALQVLD